ncbi:polyamine ABC transporter substrate-binding protein [Blastochloris viridis]|uniref:Putrescine-binding periplasmic protein n=1 Tax=Blastochloris viridis TaxID=1079 RepID=A0A0H5B9Z4_BLAVI|nr:polyamine ABC transporter substrate-binding protein [Blastochloris viridis]ALK08836.1 Putrescine-binding periplasmic protein precursor [Blastochloris viridis]BAR97864.1 putrescine ABC transporter putrescine-binding protein PotF [Blastochloris viridis]CUU41497.1 Putrescine-binding periplasmic protein precursor [Blastochloris viridis]
MVTRLGLMSVAVAAVLAVAAPAAAEAREVRVFNWSDYIDESTLEAFTKETGIEVRYNVFDSNETLETRLLAGRTGYDVVVPSGNFLQRQIKAGVFRKLDKSKLPNLVNAWPFVTEKLAVYDPGNEYGVNYMWGTTGLGYNVEMVRQRLGDEPIDSWSIVFDPAKLAKLKDCGIHVLDAPDELIPAAMAYLGLDPHSRDKADFEKAEQLLAPLRPFIRKFHSSEYINALANGDICFAVGWSGDILQAKKRAAEAAENTGRKVEVGYAIPREGTLMFFDNFAIPKDAKNVDEAHAFINFMLRPEIAAKNSSAVSYANGNLASQPLIDPAVRDDPAVYPPEATLAKLFINQPWDAATQRMGTRMWTKFKTGR